MGPPKKQKSKKRSKSPYDIDETKSKYYRKRLPDDELLKLVSKWSLFHDFTNVVLMIWITFQMLAGVAQILLNILAARRPRSTGNWSSWTSLYTASSSRVCYSKSQLCSFSPFCILLFFVSTLSGVPVTRELRPNKPYIRGGITRQEILTEDIIERDTDDYVLAPRSLTHLGIFDKLSRYFLLSLFYHNQLFNFIFTDGVSMCTWALMCILGI